VHTKRLEIVARWAETRLSADGLRIFDPYAQAHIARPLVHRTSATTNAPVIYLVLHADEVWSVGIVVNRAKHWQACSLHDIVVTKAHPVSRSSTVEIGEEQSSALFDVQHSYGKK
jgi:hypothetical protein